MDLCGELEINMLSLHSENTPGKRSALSTSISFLWSLIYKYGAEAFGFRREINFLRRKWIWKKKEKVVNYHQIFLRSIPTLKILFLASWRMWVGRICC